LIEKINLGSFNIWVIEMKRSVGKVMGRIVIEIVERLLDGKEKKLRNS
jgi:hypothetical protein